MKKIIFVLLLLVFYFSFITMTIYGKSFDHINNNLTKDDLAVTFFTGNNTKFLFVQSIDKNIGVILEAISNVDIKQEFPVLKNEKIDQYIVLNEENYNKLSYDNITILVDNIEFNDVKLEKDEENTILIHDTKKLCVIQNEKLNLSRCDYIYYLELDKIVEVPDTVKLVIYDIDISDDVRLANYDNFIDTLKLSSQYMSTLLWNRDSYQMITVP